VQFFVNVTASFSVIFLFSAAFFFQYRMFRFFDLSLAAIFVVGAYPFETAVRAGQQEVLGILLAGAVAGLAGILLMELVVQPLARRGASPLDLTLCALGVYIVGLNCIALIFGDEVLRPPALEISKSIPIATAVISGAQLGLIVLTLVSYVAIVITLRLTSVGRTFRALSDSPSLARDLGLPTGPAIILATSGGAILVGVAGALITADVGIRPTTGFPFIIPGLAAVLSFGGRDISQVLLGAAIVALTGELGGLFLGQQWRELSIFTVLALFLALRTRLVPAGLRP
jgi:branched-chain amino acid transport system permease protein